MFRNAIKKCFLVAILSLGSISLLAQEVDVFSDVDGNFTATANSTSLNRLYDNDTRTEYNFNGIPNDIVFSSEKTFAIKSMTLTSASLANRDPKEAELYGSHDGSNWQMLRNMTAGTLRFTERKQTVNISIASNQPYKYFKLRIKSLQDGGVNGAISEWRLIGEEKELPETPTDLRAIATNHQEVQLKWRDRSDVESGFEVHRSLNGKDYSVLTTLPADVTTYIDATVDAETIYYYKVCALKDRYKSDFVVSNVVVTPFFPTLTQLTKGRIYTASDQYNNSPSGEDVACLFDDDENTKFLTRSGSAWVRLSFQQKFKAEHYSITSANDAQGRDPKNWRLEGSNNGTNWTALDTRTSQSFHNRFQKRYFTIENPAEYQYYRLNITANYGDGLLQMADWLLYADIPEGNDVIALETPTNFRLENRAYHHVKLSWNDVANETSYRIERSDDGGTTFNYTYEVPANNTESYPYSLKPETDYVFKLYAVNGENTSEPATVSVTTSKKEFKEKLENYSLWILDQPSTFNKVMEIGNTAFYVIEGYKKEDINDLYYEFYAANWEYVFECYGDELSDSTLHVLLIPLEEGGGLASIYDYRNSASFYRNMVYIKANKNWFKNRSESGYIYDVMAHELCHIIEGVGGGYNGSMFYPIWGDSKWAEILQFDIFTALGSSRAASWHREYTEGVKPGGGADYPDSNRTSYWYRDFLYPTYDKYGKTDLLKKFWKLQGQHYKMRNGSFVGNSANPGGRGNLGELIHFWSAAAGVDVKPYAVQAFGWNDQFEHWLQKAKLDYPDLEYDEPEIENKVINICQNGGIISSNYSITRLDNFIDNNHQTYFLVRQDTENTALELTYQSAHFAKLSQYSVVVRDNTIPTKVKLLASQDGKTWMQLNENSNPNFDAGKLTVDITIDVAYQFFKFEFEFPNNGELKLAEIELFGVEHPGAPYGLEANAINDETVELMWSSNITEISYFEIERSDDGVDFEVQTSVDCLEIEYVDQQLIPGSYYYRIAGINKNPEKEKVYSNIAFVNTTASGLLENKSNNTNFYEVITQLSNYPNNRVAVYNLMAQKVFDTSYHTNNLLSVLHAYLSAGIYLIQLDLGKGKGVISEKIIIKK